MPKKIGNRPPRPDVVDALVLEIHGLVRDQGWLADRALEVVLRRDRKLWANERRAVAESVYGLVRWQAQLEFLLGRRPTLAERYAAWLVRFTGADPDEATRRLAVTKGALAGLEGGDARIAAIADPVERLAIEASLPRWIAARFARERGWRRPGRSRSR